jgi:hypothetical protein
MRYSADRDHCGCPDGRVGLVALKEERAPGDAHPRAEHDARPAAPRAGLQGADHAAQGRHHDRAAQQEAPSLTRVSPW